MRRFCPGLILLFVFAAVMDVGDSDATGSFTAVQAGVRVITPTKPTDGETLPSAAQFEAKGTVDPRDDVFGIVMDPTNPDNTVVAALNTVTVTGMWPGETTLQAINNGDPWTILFAGVPDGFGYVLRVETVNTAQQESIDVSFNISGKGSKPGFGAGGHKAKGKKHKVDIDANTVPKEISKSNPTPFTVKGKVKEDGGGDVAHPVYAMLFNPEKQNQKIDFVLGTTKQQGPDWVIDFKSFPKTGTEWRVRVRAFNGRGLDEKKITVTK